MCNTVFFLTRMAKEINAVDKTRPSILHSAESLQPVGGNSREPTNLVRPENNSKFALIIITIM